MARSNADGLELVVRPHKKHRNGEYNPPAITYYYRSYVYVLSHRKNIVHKLNFGPIVLPFLPKFSVEEKAHKLLSTISTSSSEKETRHSWNYSQNSFVSAGQEARLHGFNGIFLALNFWGCLYFSIFFRNFRMLSACCYSSYPDSSFIHLFYLPCPQHYNTWAHPCVIK